MFHAGNERIPLGALEFGADAIQKAIRQYHVRGHGRGSETSAL
jgi:hypothetical protein